jgi:hypothetical protein
LGGRSPLSGGDAARRPRSAGSEGDRIQAADPHFRRELAAYLADREVLQTHPTGDTNIPLTGVFRTRSPDRPNPIGVHRVTVTALEGPTTLRVGALEAIDGTPIIDIKIAMSKTPEA